MSKHQINQNGQIIQSRSPLKQIKVKQGSMGVSQSLQFSKNGLSDTKNSPNIHIRNKSKGESILQRSKDRRINHQRQLSDLLNKSLGQSQNSHKTQNTFSLSLSQSAKESQQIYEYPLERNYQQQNADIDDYDNGILNIDLKSNKHCQLRITHQNNSNDTQNVQFQANSMIEQVIPQESDQDGSSYDIQSSDYNSNISQIQNIQTQQIHMMNSQSINKINQQNLASKPKWNTYLVNTSNFNSSIASIKEEQKIEKNYLDLPLQLRVDNCSDNSSQNTDYYNKLLQQQSQFTLGQQSSLNNQNTLQQQQLQLFTFNHNNINNNTYQFSQQSQSQHASHQQISLNRVSDSMNSNPINDFNTRITSTCNESDVVHFETKDSKLIDQLQKSSKIEYSNKSHKLFSKISTQDNSQKLSQQFEQNLIDIQQDDQVQVRDFKLMIEDIDAFKHSDSDKKRRSELIKLQLGLQGSNLSSNHFRENVMYQYQNYDDQESELILFHGWSLSPRSIGKKRPSNPSNTVRFDQIMNDSQGEIISYITDNVNEESARNNMGLSQLFPSKLDTSILNDKWKFETTNQNAGCRLSLQLGHLNKLEQIHPKQVYLIDQTPQSLFITDTNDLQTSNNVNSVQAEDLISSSQTYQKTNNNNNNMQFINKIKLATQISPHTQLRAQNHLKDFDNTLRHSYTPNKESLLICQSDILDQDIDFLVNVQESTTNMDSCNNNGQLLMVGQDNHRRVNSIQKQIEFSMFKKRQMQGGDRIVSMSATKKQ